MHSDFLNALYLTNKSSKLVEDLDNAKFFLLKNYSIMEIIYTVSLSELSNIPQ